MRGSKKNYVKRIQVLNKLGTNAVWAILKMKGVERKVELGLSYNLPRGSKYENPHFFDELENEVLEFKNIYGEIYITLKQDFNARSGELTPRNVVEEEVNSWCRDNSFSGSGRRS
jgi:hypothetical protein